MLSRLARSFASIKLRWILRDGSEQVINSPPGASLLEVAQENGIDLEGACEGSMACSTCHIILQEDIYDLLPQPQPDEEDMLDLAQGLTSTSRLGCQVSVIPDMDNTKITVPEDHINHYEYK